MIGGAWRHPAGIVRGCNPAAPWPLNQRWFEYAVIATWVLACVAGIALWVTAIARLVLG